MKVVVFGASRGTGRHVVEQALSAGYQVTAVVRTPGAESAGDPRLRVVRGDVLDPASVAAAVAGQDAVISTIGPGGRGPTTLMSEGIANIGRGMRLAGVRRLVCVSTTGVDERSDVAFPMNVLLPVVVRPLLREIWADALRMEQWLQRQEGLDWTVVRAPMLTNGAPTGRYRTSLNRHVGKVSRIPRRDLAHFLVALLERSDSIRAWAEISV